MVNKTVTRLAVGLVALAGYGSIAAAAEIGFQEAVDRALGANPRARESAAHTEAARAGVETARGAALPRLRVEFNAASSNNPLTVFGYRLSQRNATFRDFGLADYSGPGSLDTAPGALDHPGYASNYDTAVALSFPLYSGGADSARYEAARYRLDASRSREAMTDDQLVFNVLRSYQGVFAARRMAAAARQAAAAAEASLETARALAKRGLALHSDVLTAEANLADAKSAEQAATAGVEDALEDFRVTLGAPRTADLSPAAPVTLPAPAGDLPRLETEAIAQNLTLQSLHAQLKVQGAAVDIAHAGNRPHVDLTLRHDWNADSPALAGSSNTVLVSVSWDLFTFGAQTGAVREAASERRAMAASIRDAEDRVRLDVARRVREMRTAQTREDAGREALRHAAEATRLVKLRYAQGIATLNDVLDAQARLDQARAAVVQASYDALLARAALRLILHDLDPASAVPAPPPDGDPREVRP